MLDSRNVTRKYTCVHVLPVRSRFDGESSLDTLGPRCTYMHNKSYVLYGILRSITSLPLHLEIL